MKCHSCNEPISNDEATWLSTDYGYQPYCETCADSEGELFSDDPNDGDIFDHYRFPT